jgi:hypothetical protein
MSAEDRLRDILRSEAQEIVPAGDGLAKIQARVARRRRLRIWTIPGAAVATAGAVLAVFVLAHDDPRTTQTLVPGATATPAPSEPTTSTPTPPAPVPVDSYSGPAVWPITSQAQADAWDTTAKPWVEDGLAVGRRFVKDYVGLSDVTIRQDCVSCEVLAVVADGKDVATIVLAHYTAHGKHLFTVAGVSGQDLKVSSPKEDTSVTSPLTVTGTIEGVDEHVVVRLRDEAGKQVAQGDTQAGSGAPWRATLSWTDRSWIHGSLVLWTGNFRDGGTSRLVVVAVSQGPAGEGPTFAALVDGHVSQYDGATGELVHQLTFPPAGKQDVEAAWSPGGLLWVRQATTGTCGGEVDLRLDEQTSTLTRSTTARYGTPAVSDGTDWFGWVEQPCDGSPHTLVVVNGSSPSEPRRLEGPTGSTVELLDVRRDGTALVRTNDRGASGPGTIGILPAGATNLSALTAIAADPGCSLASGAALAVVHVVAFQTCGEEIQLVRWYADGRRVGKDDPVADATPRRISERDGLVLVQRSDGDIATFNDGRYTTLVAADPAHCGPGRDRKGCLTSPSW